MHFLDVRTSCLVMSCPYPLAPPEYSVLLKQFNKHSVKRIIPIMCSVHKVDERAARTAAKGLVHGTL